jgi:hypothetical protein
MLTLKTRAALEDAPIPPSWKAALAERLEGEPLAGDDPDRDGAAILILEAGDEAKPLPETLNLSPRGARLADLLRAGVPNAEVPAEIWPDAFEWVDEIAPDVFLGFVLRGNDYGYLVLADANAKGFDPETAALLREAAKSGQPAQG